MLKVAVVGASGYAGEELLKALVKHKKVKIVSVSAKIDKPQRIDQIYPFLAGKLNLVCDQPDFEQIVPEVDLAFLALPHRVSMQIAPKFLEAKIPVIDLSADYRLKDKQLYKKWYGAEHENSQYLPLAVYGLPEVNREKIKQAKLIANPGCYPTSVILGVLPLLLKGVVDKNQIIADSKTGLSGAGREKEAQLMPQMKDNFCAYKVDQHQHSPEINQELSSYSKQKVEITFVPHLIPIKRGILSTIYLRLKADISQEDAQSLYQEYYANEPFIKILPAGNFPQLKDVTETNFCHVGIKVNSGKKEVIVVSAIDNLVKGASGQAVQNMNIIYGFNEKEGLL